MQQAEHLYLVISALGADRPGIVDAITQPINQSEGNILDSRMTVLGGEFAVLMLVEGTEAAIGSLEQTLPLLQQDHGLTIISKRTKTQPSSTPSMPYAVSVVSIDHPGIVNKLSSFFSKKGINIQNLETDNYHAPHTGTPMFSVEMTVNVPVNTPKVNLRNEFLDFCEQMNLDATMEAKKKQ
jgi:glycine cleavage system transcriptional repressor